MNTLIIVVAQYLFLVPIVTVAWFAWTSLAAHRRAEFSWLVCLSAVGTVLLVKVAGLLWRDPRPFVGHFVPLIHHVPDNGFPSDHTALTMFLALVLWEYNRRLSLVLAGLSLLIGLARVAAGVHHVVDIAGGAALAGCAYVVARVVVHQVVRPRLGHSPTS